MVQFDRPVTHHPDTGTELASFNVPRWSEFVILASQCYSITHLGYLGVDIVLDKVRRPMVLELNARPGLAIQVASGIGLQPRIELIDREDQVTRNEEERAAFSMKQFA